MTQPGLIAEWRYSTAYRVSSVLGGLMVASLPLGLVLLDANKGPAWLIPALFLFLGGSAVWGILNVLTQRVRLFGNRIDEAGFLGTRTLPRQGILGRRRQSNGDFVIVPREGQGRALILPQRIMKTSAFLEWLESLDDLDAADHLKAQADLEADATLGATTEARRDFLVGIRRACGIASLIGIVVAFWAIFFPRPFDLVAGLCIVAPLAAIVICFRWQAAVSLIGGGDNEPTAGLFGLWFSPAMAVAALGLAVQQVDWRTPLIVAAPVSLLFLGASLIADSRQRNVVGAIFAMVVAYAWAWGTLVVVNTRLDYGLPVEISARVERRSDGETREPKLTLTSPALPGPVESLSVSARRFKASPVGATVCLRVFPGAFGWRYVFIVDCLPNTLVPPVSRDTH